MSILTRVDVCLVCAYICCFHVAAVQGTSQECDDEVCLLQNLVRKPSVLPSESGLDETNANFLQMTSHIDDAMKEAALEAMKDLQKFCTWTSSQSGKSLDRFYKLAGGKVANALLTGSGQCVDGVLWRIEGQTAGKKDLTANNVLMAECEKACNDPKGVQPKGVGGSNKPFYQCLAVGVLTGAAVKKGTGCWALTGKSDVDFPTFKSPTDCFTDFAKNKVDSDNVKYSAGRVKYQVCAPTLDNIKALVGDGSKAAAGLAALKVALKKKLKNGLNANGVKLDKVRFENGDLVYNLVGIGVKDFESTTTKDQFALAVKQYVERKMTSKKTNVAVVQVLAG